MKLMGRVANKTQLKYGWRHVLPGAFLLLTILSCVTDSGKKQENLLLAKSKYNEAVYFSSQNSRPEMYARLKEAIRLDPLEPNYHWSLAMAYFADGDLNGAERELHQTIRLNDNSAEAYKQLGRLYMQTGDLDKAIYYFKESLRKPGITLPQHIHNWIALCYYNQGRTREAESEWLAALRIKDNEEILLNLALVYLDTEQFDKALALLNKAVAVNPRFAAAHYRLGLLHLKNKNLELAGKHFNQAIQLDPNSEQARSSREYIELMTTTK